MRRWALGGRSGLREKERRRPGGRPLRYRLPTVDCRLSTVSCRLLNHPARKPSARVARGLRCQVVRLFVKDDAASDDGVGPGLDRQHVRGDVEVTGSVGLDLDVAEVARVPFRLLRPGLRHSAPIEMTPRLLRVTIRTIPLLMDVQAMGARRRVLDWYARHPAARRELGEGGRA